MKTGVVFSPIYYRHNPGRSHPESAKRLITIVRELKRSRLQGVSNWQFIEPNKAHLSDVGLVHDAKYIEFVKDTCALGGDILDEAGDTVASPESFEAALYAVGGALEAVNLVMSEDFQNAFAFVRPPGHHAGKRRACGFCIFNNVAIAATDLLRRFKLKRVLILDIDAHHGNGTQQVFYDTDRVLYISLHEDPRDFPGKGFIGEVGEGAGLGYSVNVPLPFGTSDEIYLKAMNEVVESITRQYKPQFILVSAGLDGHYTDPVGNLSLSALCYGEVFETICRLALETCKGKLVSVLEGGYSLNFVGKIAAVAVAKMCDSPYHLEDKIPSHRGRVERRGEKVLKEVKRVQRVFWDV